MTPDDQAGKVLLFRVMRRAFRMLPLTEAARDRMRQHFVDRYLHLVPESPRGEVADPSARRVTLRADEPAIGYARYRQAPLPVPLPATVVAFYLPQFHPIPENDAWWGKGFTEWRNVTRALPQFEGHLQPRLPADLGFYDLRNPQTLHEQARLARDYGIGAFCFYFYWFSGATLLEQPLRQWLEDPSLELPFCLCWANENWSRRWDGRGEDLLVSQRHDPQDDLAFITHVSAYLRDPRYLRVGGRPLLLVYRPELLPDAAATVQRWRAWCLANGVGEIHVACVQGFGRPDPRTFGFDAAVEFPPNLSNPRNITAEQRLLNPEFHGEVLDWRELADDYAARPMPPYPAYPAVNVGWDNEPRRPGKGRVYLHASPRRYRDWLQATILRRLAPSARQDRIVFINAWNEWAEGAVLEPDARLGHAWLEATRAALQRAASPAATAAPLASTPCAVIHAWYVDVFDELLGTLQATGIDWRVVVTTTADRAEAVRNVLDTRHVDAEIQVFPNHGRDILPFLHVANRLLDEGVELVLKLHTKRSVHRPDGDTWRQELVTRLTSPDRVRAIIDGFAQEPTLGLVGPEGHLQPLAEFWGDNAHAMAYLARRAGMPMPRDDDDFVAGSMFWARLEALRPVLDAHLQDSDFETEDGQLDGTLAHAIERVIAAWAVHAGYRVAQPASLAGAAPRA